MYFYHPLFPWMLMAELPGAYLRAMARFAEAAPELPPNVIRFPAVPARPGARKLCGPSASLIAFPLRGRTSALRRGA